MQQSSKEMKSASLKPASPTRDNLRYESSRSRKWDKASLRASRNKAKLSEVQPKVAQLQEEIDSTLKLHKSQERIIPAEAVVEHEDGLSIPPEYKRSSFNTDLSKLKPNPSSIGRVVL